MLERKTKNIGRENEPKSNSLLLLLFSKKKGPLWGKQISLGLGLQNRGKNYSATVCSGKGK